MRQKICNTEDLHNSSCKEFIVQNGPVSKDAFLLNFKNQYYAYINSCPHTGVSLNWQKDLFLSADELYIQCSLHGALFEPAGGRCIHGPCQGKHLQSLEIAVVNGVIYLTK